MIPPVPPPPEHPPKFNSEAGADDDSVEIELDEADESEEFMTRPRPRTPAREPWFIRFLEGYTFVVMWICIAIIFLGLVAAIVIFIGDLTASERERFGPNKLAISAMFAGNIVGLFVALVGVLFSAAVVLLFVDMARSLRTLVKQGRSQ